MRIISSPATRSRWTAERLRAWVREHCDGSIAVLANREPFRHDRTADGNAALRRSSGGLVTALEPLIEACSGVWIGHGAGTADRAVVDAHDGIDVPPDAPRYRLRRVWLDPAEERGYYYGFANEGLWPLCHRAHVQPIFRSADYEAYRTVNARFAQAVREEVDGSSPVVLVQDYHFGLAPRYIRERLPHATIVAFWHIPWPNPRDFEICPWGAALLDGLLGSSIVGFQTPDDCSSFMETVARLVDCDIDVDRRAIAYRGREILVRDYPVSVEWPSRWVEGADPVDVCRAGVRAQLNLPADAPLGVGVDRMDYTKGINEKFLAVERLLESHSELRGRFVFVQVAEPSRECLDAYRALRARVRETADRINQRFGAEGYQPIVLRETRHEPAEVYRLLRAADVCYVSSLHDGMNLVAKEFVAARDDNGGVLMLSAFAGAARELTAASIVNPYAVDDVADAMADALRMPADEKASRMRSMRSIVAQSNTYKWIRDMLGDAMRCRAEGGFQLPDLGVQSNRDSLYA
jgi:trehalose 6-phosphate synthase